MIITLYKSGPGDEKWTKPDLSSHLLYTGLCKPGGMIRKYGGHTGHWAHSALVGEEGDVL